MERFHNDGHLTDDALLALIQEEPLEELARLEIAEHLAFCDICLQRYTDLLAERQLLVPACSCHGTLWQRIRRRSLRLLTSRYATAAAAITLALTMLWGSAALSGSSTQEHRQFLETAGTAVTQQVRNLPERWNDSLNGLFSNISSFFDYLGGSRPQTNQGGINS